MGLEPFRHLVNDLRFRHLPMILETPKGIEDGEDLDARNLRILRGTCGIMKQVFGSSPPIISR